MERLVLAFPGERLKVPAVTALAVLRRAVERLWAERAAEAIREACGRVAESVRIPPEHVAEAADAYRAAVATAGRS
ncbi:hypothetical protein [Streptomyces sp. NPDC058579]|uniref:hypothetical protein n=1 Tax=Streptomyces sp. NPDC058579 TaxID=3346548 RepID=UPI003651AD7C